ncbi:MAG: response regulator [Actinomycetota bacterium]
MSRKKILVIDDEPAVHRLLQIILADEGFDIVGMEGHEGSGNVVSRSKPDLIILDIRMPEVDGLEVLSMLKSDEETSNIPVIILTASGRHGDKEMARRLGAERYFTKPFQPAELLKAIRALCPTRDASHCTG